MTAYATALTLTNGIAAITTCENAVKASSTYEEALAQVEGIIFAAWNGQQDELSKSICDQLWLTYHV